MELPQGLSLGASNTILTDISFMYLYNNQLEKILGQLSSS